MDKANIGRYWYLSDQLAVRNNYSHGQYLLINKTRINNDIAIDGQILYIRSIWSKCIGMNIK